MMNVLTLQLSKWFNTGRAHSVSKFTVDVRGWDSSVQQNMVPSLDQMALIYRLATEIPFTSTIHLVSKPTFHSTANRSTCKQGGGELLKLNTETEWHPNVDTLP